MGKLGVNVDHVATLRQARGVGYPDPLQAALLAEKAGADSITVHLREDRRHIQDEDVLRIHRGVAVPLNLEMAVTREMIDFAVNLKPTYCCLVPEKREELTTEGGLDVVSARARIKSVIDALASCGIQTSLFIDPDVGQVEAAESCGARRVELHTGAFAEARRAAAKEAEHRRLLEATNRCVALGLEVNAGHGLNYENIAPIAAIAAIGEFNIGHSIVSRAVFTGLEKAVREMKRLIREAR